MEHFKNIRTKIDSLDDEILKLFGERFLLVREAGEIKAKHNLELVQKDRVKEVLDRVAKTGSSHGLDPSFVQNLYELIISEAHNKERKIIDGYKNAS